MWIFTKTGFVSVVQHKQTSKMLLVRARCREHLAEFVGPSLALQMFTTPEGDYRYRVQVMRETFAALLMVQASSIDYSNFKDSVEDDSYHKVLMEIWKDARALDQRHKRDKA